MVLDLFIGVLGFRESNKRSTNWRPLVGLFLSKFRDTFLGLQNGIGSFSVGKLDVFKFSTGCCYAKGLVLSVARVQGFA